MENMDVKENNLGHFEVDEEQKYKEELKKLKKKQYDEQKKLREQEETLIKKERAQKSLVYLLNKSEKFANFFKERVETHVNGDNEVLKDNVEELQTNATFDILKQINFFNGVLKPYQVEGLVWLTVLFENGVNGILADEMGLGKTIQVIALLCHLYEKEVPGPYMVVAPLSTIPNWSFEFQRFAPQIPVVVFYGNKFERPQIKKTIFTSKYQINRKKVHPVFLMSYEMPLKESLFLNKYKWQYLIIDEGHRIKNHRSKLTKALFEFKSRNKLLLTGTPLQNNMTELWALLNFIMPHIFTDLETFASLFLPEDLEKENIQKEESTHVISNLHKILAPFMLRRLKVDVLKDLVPKKEVLVYCPMSKLQRDLYMYTIKHNIAALRGKENNAESDFLLPKSKRRCTRNISYNNLKVDDFEDFISPKNEPLQNLTGNKVTKQYMQYCVKMQNVVMMFKKVVNHPYLVHFPLKPDSDKKELLINEQLICQSGKMLVLDAMLTKLKKMGHKVLIFSTLVMTLDLIEEFVILRGYLYGRLDGCSTLEDREASIRDFNNNPNIFLFLISTRAGGLGVNLTGADTVILYDRDWNPQVDIQAQDRCHRIGQLKPVMVYSLVTKNTIDEKIINCGNRKRKLEKIVIKDKKFKLIKDEEAVISFEELQELLESEDCTHKIHSNGFVFTDDELNRLLDRSELYEEMAKNKMITNKKSC